MGGFRTRLAVVVVLAAALLVAACGEDPAEEPTAGGSSPVPTAPADEVARDHAARAPDLDLDAGGAAPPEDATGRDEVTAWFAREHGSRVWLEPETIHLDEATVAVLRAAVEAVVSGQSINPELISLVPPGTEVLDVAIEDGVALINLSRDILSVGGSSAQEVAFAQQLAQTATQFDTVDAVRLLVEGEPVTELWGHVDWSEPITADPRMLSPIIVASPRWGETRPPGPVTATGTSVTYESTVVLRLLAPDGSLVEETFTTAAQPDVGRRGPWSHTFDTEATTPGAWTIEAIEPDPSGGEGRPAFTTSVRFQVS